MPTHSVLVVPSQRWRLRLTEVFRYVTRAPAVERVYRRIVDEEREERLDSVMARHASTTPFHGSKYRNYRWYLRENIARALALGLADQPPSRVLDLGCGAGYFLAVCDALGHAAQGVDIPDSAFFEDVRTVLGVDCTPHRITAASLDGPSADSDARYDIVTAFSVTFNSTADGPWRANDWASFLARLECRLSPTGRAVFRFNCASRDDARGPAPLVRAIGRAPVAWRLRQVDVRTVELTR